jgi:polar amino acid transport system permease protein
MNYEWNFQFLWQYKDLISIGVLNTIYYTVLTITLGCALGLVFALIRFSHNKFLTYPSIALMEVFRCTPLIVQLIWFYYAFPVITGLDIPASAAAIMALTLYGSVFYAEVFRSGIMSIQSGQWDAGRALGMKDYELLKRIILPQAVKIIIPPFMNQSVMQLKNTSLISVLAIGEIVYQGGAISADTYRPLEVYTMVAVVYFLLLFPLTNLSRYCEKRLSVSD